MCKIIKVTAIDRIECDNCGEIIEKGKEVLIDIHLIEGAYFFCSSDCAANAHGEQLSEEEEQRQKVLEDYGIGDKIDEFIIKGATKGEWQYEI